MTDDDLLRFDYGRLAGHWTQADGKKALAEYGETYRAQLVAAHFAESLCEGMLNKPGATFSTDYLEGFEHGLRDMTAHLRQGDLLPGGILYREEINR